MKQEEFFQNAKWVGAPERTQKSFSILRGHFFADEPDSVRLNILGLGFFLCYINGECINPDTFLPVSSEFEKDSMPKGEILSGNRVYVPQFDITPFVKKGNNTIAVHFGGGWYLHYFTEGVKRLPKAIYCISVEEKSEIKYFTSDENCRIGKSYIGDYVFTHTEAHDYTGFENCFDSDFDDSKWENAVLTEGLDTEYCTTACPIDKLIAELPVRTVSQKGKKAIYDCGRNTTGYPVLEISAEAGEELAVRFSEEILPDGSIDPEHIHNQLFRITADGEKRIVQPDFIWYAFRYMEVSGNAEVKLVKEIHADVPVSSSFECDNETINWIYNTFTHTMLTNLHIGHPSDCPHIERRGYTGDGQLTCNAALSALDAKEFYEKWLRDIADGQDVISGHIQYTAPYALSGGGPGGWGTAIVEVPYRLYLHCGDKRILEEYYKNMRRYIDYLEEHSEFGLVTSDKEGAWCLGEWCGPNVLYPDKDITIVEKQQILIPAAFVNTYFMVKALEKMCTIAEIIGKEEDTAEYKEKIAYRKSAIKAAYFNAFDGNFIMNVQGANSFAVDLGLGDERTYANMVSYYKKLGYLDTGIFATDAVIRTLFEHGDAELAVKLLKNDGEQGFEQWRKNGATTFLEYWNRNSSRSHNHHMFGAVTAYFFEYLLGIKQEENTAGYTSIIIEPEAVSCFERMCGSMKTGAGTVSVSYKKENKKIKFEILIPENTKAVFKGFSREIKLNAGKNAFEFNC